jgi:hypothetical protein
VYLEAPYLSNDIFITYRFFFLKSDMRSMSCIAYEKRDASEWVLANWQMPFERLLIQEFSNQDNRHVQYVTSSDEPKNSINSLRKL